MIALGLILIALAVPGTAWILRSTILAYEDRRIAWARERWNERVDAAIAALEDEGPRLQRVEADLEVLRKDTRGLATKVELKAGRR